jgi:hypothetical protein
MNLREYFTRYPLGCESYGAQWLELWAALGRVLEMPAQMWYGTESWPEKRVTWVQWMGFVERHTVADCLETADKTRRSRSGLQFARIALLDGSVVKEWGGK